MTKKSVSVSASASVAVAALFFILYSLFFRSAVLENTGFVIAPGASVSSVASDLGQGRLFKFFVRLNGGLVQAGDYELPAGASIWRLARIFSRGQIAAVAIVVPEGMTVKQITGLLDSKPEFAKCKVQNAIYKDGELFPDTYIVAKGTTDCAVLDLMAKKMEQVRKSFVGARSFEPPAPLKDWNDVLTLAAIVQKETPKISEMPIVASVYLNRLRIRMRLQADPTVVYAITDGLGDMRGRPLFSKHLQVDSPYNTYRHYGLPPAPIANVGLDAISAVMHPADTDYLYFVADGTGGHQFSRTLDEHNSRRREWQEIKKGLGLGIRD